MNERMVQQIDLSNGLVLKLWDRSRILAGDRWRVSFAAEIEILIRPELFPQDQQRPGYEDVRFQLGETALYRHVSERSFVDQIEKNKVWEDLKKQFLDSNLEYLAHPDFAFRLLVRKYTQGRTPTPSWYRV